jgi:hypothetical protein
MVISGIRKPCKILYSVFFRDTFIAENDTTLYGIWGHYRNAVKALPPPSHFT